MNHSQRISLLSPPSILLVALSLSVGWGVRGNWGHEYGAMIPGALAAMAACLLSGRADWYPRIGYFAMFGALGWAFGGSMSYMQVIAYTHSGHGPSVLYGFACLFLLGFLWGSMGGAGTALPALFDSRRLGALFPAILAVFAIWTLESFGLAYLYRAPFDFETTFHWLNQYDTDWIAATLAIAAVLVLALVRQKWDEGSSLVIHMAVGWWLGFAVLVLALGLRMTPPRGDNWAGCTGMVIGLIVYFTRRRMPYANLALLVGGFVGGFGFSFGQFLKLLELKSGYQTNWHSVLEQSYGFINGVGIALTLALLSRLVPKVEDPSADNSTPRWQHRIALIFVLLVIPYLSIQKNLRDAWLRNNIVPEEMYGISTHVWFHAAYLILMLTVGLLIVTHPRHSRTIVPENPIGRGQLLYLLFLWWIVIGNFTRTTPFAPQRLVTEGVIHINACLCTLMILWLPGRENDMLPSDTAEDKKWMTRVVVAGVSLFVFSTLLQFAATRGLYGNHQAPNASLHLRFGPNATRHKK